MSFRESCMPEAWFPRKVKSETTTRPMSTALLRTTIFRYITRYTTFEQKKV